MAHSGIKSKLLRFKVWSSADFHVHKTATAQKSLQPSTSIPSPALAFRCGEVNKTPNRHRWEMNLVPSENATKWAQCLQNIQYADDILLFVVHTVDIYMGIKLTLAFKIVIVISNVFFFFFKGPNFVSMHFWSSAKCIYTSHNVYSNLGIKKVSETAVNWCRWPL